LCRDCSRLPAEELQFRQGQRDIERLRHGLFVPRKKRKQFDAFLNHPNARVRELAQQILAEQRRYAEDCRREREEDECRREREEDGYRLDEEIAPWSDEESPF